MLRLSDKLKTDTPADQQNNLNGIDLAKFLCALLVFIIHVAPFQGELSGIPLIITFGLQHYLCRLAVPFYFVCSGFFLFRKMSLDQPDTDRMKRYCFKILRLFGTWQLLLVIGYTEHLWYLGATVVAVILLGLCLHFRMKYRHMCILAGAFYLVGLLGDSYYGLLAPLKEIPVLDSLFRCYEFTFDNTRNGVFMGFIFVLLGAVLSQRRMMLKPLGAAVCFALSMIGMFAELCLLKYFDIPKDYNMYLCLFPAVYFLFAFAYAIPLKDSGIYRCLRSIGMLVYFLHISLQDIVSRGLGALDTWWNLGLTRYLFLFTLAVTLLIAAGIEHLSRKDRFQWLNWLLN